MNKTPYLLDEEQRLRDIIRDVILETINERGPLNEMAYSLRDYKHHADSHLTQIAINWCLVRYTDYDENYLGLRHHWQSELLSHMENIARREIKGHTGKRSTKAKVLHQVWDDAEFNRNLDAVDEAVRAKMEAEGIDIKSDTYLHVLTSFIEHSEQLIDLISTNNYSLMRNYVDKI